MTKNTKIALVSIGALLIGYWLFSSLTGNKAAEPAMEPSTVPAGESIPETAPVSTGATSPTKASAPKPAAAPKTVYTIPVPGDASLVRTMVGTGNFSGQVGRTASGAVQVVKVGSKYFLQLASDFSVAAGPSLSVYFGRDGSYARGAEISVLKSTSGAQNYEVPAETDPERYDEVWIWSKSLSSPFARAVLQ